MASISFKCTDEEKELIKKMAAISNYGGMSGLCRHIVVSAVQAMDYTINGTEYEDVKVVKTEMS